MTCAVYTTQPIRKLEPTKFGVRLLGDGFTKCKQFAASQQQSSLTYCSATIQRGKLSSTFGQYVCGPWLPGSRARTLNFCLVSVSRNPAPVKYC